MRRKDSSKITNNFRKMNGEPMKRWSKIYKHKIKRTNRYYKKYCYSKSED